MNNFNEEIVKLLKPMSTISIDEMLGVFNSATGNQLSKDDLETVKIAFIAYLKTLHYSTGSSVLTEMDFRRYLEYLQVAGLLKPNADIYEYINNDQNIMEEFHNTLYEFLEILFSMNKNDDENFIILKENIEGFDYHFALYFHQAELHTLWIAEETFLINLQRLKFMPFTIKEVKHIFGFRTLEHTALGKAIMNDQIFNYIANGSDLLDYIKHELNMPRYTYSILKHGDEIIRLDLHDTLNNLRYRFE